MDSWKGKPASADASDKVDATCNDLTMKPRHWKLHTYERGGCVYNIYLLFIKASECSFGAAGGRMLFKSSMARERLSHCGLSLISIGMAQVLDWLAHLYFVIINRDEGKFFQLIFCDLGEFIYFEIFKTASRLIHVKML